MKTGENFWWRLLRQASAFGKASAFAWPLADGTAGRLTRTPLDAGPTLAI
ncbi:MAG: hypothetical protein ABSG78_22445 [Verrucomicrobiota bacterium]